MDGYTFHWADYVLFSLSLLMTVAVGIIFAIKDRWGTQSSESYLMANRDLNWMMVGVSYFATKVSAVMFVGGMSELYYTGIQFLWAIPGLYIAIIYTSVVTVTKFFRLGHTLTSAYEYLEYRFSLPVRMLGSGIFGISTLLYMAVILYAPCLILSQVSALDIRLCVVIGASVCLIYTGFGGMKAVVWIDNIQVFIMMIGLLVLVVKGTLDAGGIRHVFDVYSKGQRVTASNIDASPWTRHTVWNLVFLGAFSGMASSGSHQMLLQRYLTIKKMRKAQLAPLFGITLLPIFLSLVFIVAMCAFAKVGGNEPLLYGQIAKRGQIFPYYMMLVLQDLPGMPGLIVASSFAAALSTLSSGQNALAAIFLEDFVRPIHRKRTGRTLSSAASGKISRITGVLLGVVIMGLGLLVLSLDDMVFSLTRSVESFVSGPVFVLMAAGFFLPFVETWGVIAGCLCSLVWAIQMYVGSLKYSSRIGYNMAPLYMENFTVEVTYTPRHQTPTLYDVSYTWYVFLDVVIGLVVASIVSLCIQIHRYRVRSKQDSKFRWQELLPNKMYRYTWDDFLVGIGKRNPLFHMEATSKSVKEDIYIGRLDVDLERHETMPINKEMSL